MRNLILTALLLVGSFSFASDPTRALIEFDYVADYANFEKQDLEKALLAIDGLFEKNDLPVEFISIQFSDFLKLLSVTRESTLSDEVVEASLRALQERIDYWKNNISLDFLKEFIKNTEYNNPYHLLLIREGDRAYINFLIELGVFSGFSGDDRSLEAFLTHHLNGEGLTNGEAMLEKERWVEVFKKVGLGQAKLSEVFSNQTLMREENLELLQRIPQSLTVKLLELFEEHTDIVSKELLVYAMNVGEGNHQIGVLINPVRSTLEYISNLGLDESEAKRRVLPVLIFTYENDSGASVLRERDKMDAFYETMASDTVLSCRGLVN